MKRRWPGWTAALLVSLGLWALIIWGVVSVADLVIDHV